MLNNEQGVQVCDATGADRLTAVGNTIIIYNQRTFLKLLAGHDLSHPFRGTGGLTNLLLFSRE
jgi:hypothetical protein